MSVFESASSDFATRYAGLPSKLFAAWSVPWRLCEEDRRGNANQYKKSQKCKGSWSALKLKSVLIQLKVPKNVW